VAQRVQILFIECFELRAKSSASITISIKVALVPRIAARFLCHPCEYTCRLQAEEGQDTSACSRSSPSNMAFTTASASLFLTCCSSSGQYLARPVAMHICPNL
jgi:hypothetical protein